MAAIGSRKLVEEAHAEVERRMGATAAEVLKAEWPAYATARAREAEWEQVVRDVSSTARLNKPDLLADYLTVIAEEQFKVPANAEVSLATAHKLIAARRDIEIDALGNMPVPEIELPPEPKGVVATIWRWVSRTVVVIAVLFFGLTGLGILLVPGGGLKPGERVGMGLGLIGIAATLVFVFFFGRRTKEKMNRRAFKRAMRNAVERNYR